jgi:hypothetical protein
MSRHSRCPDLHGLGDSGCTSCRYRTGAIDFVRRYRSNYRPRHRSPRPGIHRHGHCVCGGVYSYRGGESCQHPRACGGCDAPPCTSRCGRRLRLRPHSVSPDHFPALRPCRSRPNSVSRRCEPAGFRSTATVGRHRAASSRSLTTRTDRLSRIGAGFSLHREPSGCAAVSRRRFAAPPVEPSRRQTVASNSFSVR